jgi:hypothetical protein
MAGCGRLSVASLLAVVVPWWNEKTHPAHSARGGLLVVDRLSRLQLPI